MVKIKYSDLINVPPVVWGHRQRFETGSIKQAIDDAPSYEEAKKLWSSWLGEIHPALPEMAKSELD